MSNLILKKTTTAIFLAIVLLVGTFAAISPSFIIKGANAQSESESYNYGMNDDRYNDYKRGYGMDNDYDKKSYEYKQKYPPYGKDDRKDKSKDSSESISINKFNCININLNINGNNTGDINIGNKGAAKGYVDDFSSGGDGYDNERYYDDRYDNKKDKGSDCIINNNNNNTNIVSGAGGGNITELLTCEECFENFLSQEQIAVLEADLANSGITVNIGDGPVTVNNLADICVQLGLYTSVEDIVSFVEAILDVANIDLTIGIFTDLILCILADLKIEIDIGDLVEIIIEIFEGIDNVAAVVSTFQQPEYSPVINQGIEDSSELTAMEKITKLKTQWLNQLP